MIRPTISPGPRPCRLFLILFFLLITGPCDTAWAGKPVKLAEGLDSIIIGKYIDVLEDQQGTFTIDQVSSADLAARFTANVTDCPNFGFTPSTYWVRFSLGSEIVKNNEWLLEISYPLFDQINLFLPTANGDYLEKKAGDLLPFASREISNRLFLFNLPATIPANTYIYLRFKTESTMNIPLTIWNVKAFNAKDHHAQFGLGIYYGFILLMVIYSSLMLILLRDINYLTYLVFIINFGFFQTIMNGSAYEYLWPTMVWWNNYSMPVFVALSALGVCLFARTFLTTRTIAPLMDKILFLLSLLCIIPPILSLAGHYPPAIKSSSLLGLLSVVASVTSGVICMKRGYRPARYFLVAWSMFCLGVTISALRAFGLLPANFFTLSGPQYGSSLTMLLLALALADRVNIMKIATAKAEEQYKTIFDNANEGIFRTTPDGRIVMANQAFADIFGYDSPEELIQKVPNITRTYLDPARRHELMTKLASHGSCSNFETRHKQRDGTIVDLSINAHATRNKSGEIIYLDGMLADITARKRSAELKKARDAAEAANAAKSEFLANMSHEIRTPMNGIIGMTELLLDTRLDQEQREFMGTVKTSAEVLLAIINDILDFSKIEAGRLELEHLDFNLRQTLEDICDILALRAQQKNLELICQVDPEVPSLLVGDLGRLRQIIINLATNAIKFTNEGEVFIKAAVEKDLGQDVLLRFTVNDTGIGIPDHLIHKLFDPFTQGDSSTTRKYGGTGLGLSISSQLVGMMGGEINVASEVGRGSTFWFTVRLQRQTDQETAPNTSLRDTPVLAGSRILAVDDNATNCSFLRKLISAWGCKSFAEAPDCETALTIMREAASESRPFDLVILDMEMPKMASEIFGETIKNDPLLHTAKLIIMTSIGLRGDANLHAEKGYTAYLTKPIKESLLKKCLEEIVQGKEPAVAIITNSSLVNSPRSEFRILVVEDNIVNQQVATAILANLGYRTKVAANGREALNALTENHFDLVIMDCEMPEMDGYEATRNIREWRDSASEELRRKGNVVIVAMTAHAMAGEREKCLAAGMNDFISKPVSSMTLNDTLREWLPVPAAIPADDSASPELRRTADRDILDHGALMKRLKNKQELYAAILKMFLEKTPGIIDDLQHALEQNNAKAAGLLAHNLKGTTANLGAVVIYDSVSVLEQLCNRQDLEGAEKILPEIRAKFADLRTEIIRNLDIINKKG